jgi:CBS domain containing-hemolysin-like protein
MNIFPVLVVILVVVTLIAVNALYVAGEFAIVSARRTRLTQMAKGGSRLANMLLGVIKNPNRLDNYIAASQVGITISSIMLGIYAQQAIAPRVEPWLAGMAGEAAAGASAVIVLLFFTTLQVIFGELMPKSIALQYPERTAMLTAVPVRWSAEFLLRPLIVLLNGSGRLLLKLLRVPAGGEHSHIHSPEEILLLVRESHKSGLIDADERRMLDRVFRVSETRAAEIIVPRPRIVAAEADEPLKAILEKSAHSAYSRLPVFEGDLDHILGYVHLQDIFKLYRQDAQASVRSVVREAPFVPETVSVTQVWNEMNKADSFMAFVFDEFGGITGLITREDVIEELFGELQGEFDQEPALVRHLSEGRIVVPGNMSISTLSEVLETELPQDNFFTVAGLIENQLGRIPEVGDQVDVQEYQFQVEAADGNTVTAVCIVSPKNNLPQEDEGAREEE